MDYSLRKGRITESKPFKTKKEAIDFYHRAGILTKKGNLTKHFK